MYQDYSDIRSLINREPTWFDESSVPRYCNFHPDRVANIYAVEVALAEVSCQGCGKTFLVAFSGVDATEMVVSKAIRSKSLHYGDPPNVQCCDAGPSMNSVRRKVHEYWSRHERKYLEGNQILDDAFLRWKRDPSLEIDIFND